MPELASAAFRTHYHACAFVSGPAEEQQVIDPFFIEGMLRGEKAIYIVDPAKRCSHAERLGAECPAQDLLEVKTWDDAHVRGGYFETQRMLQDLEELLQQHAETGKPPMRLVGQMGWVFSSPPGIDQLVAYEATVNELLSRHKTPTVCVYDTRKLNGALMMDLLRAHPLTVVNGVIYENPFFTPAAQLLSELRQRSAAC